MTLTCLLSNTLYEMGNDFEPQKRGPKKIHLQQGYKILQPHTQAIHIESLFLQEKAVIIQ